MPQGTVSYSVNMDGPALLAVVFMGWPAMIASLALIALGIWRCRPRWLVAAAVVAVLPSIYLGMYPSIHAAVLLPLLLVAAAYVLARWQRREAALLLTLPYVGLVAWLGYAVLSQPTI
jgi:hypothetical protein